ncbi:hypothetical protein IWW36_000946 [Coemansia brasiliensis]|uniref:DUF833-domain-containing protein n=1 Tax=Coemansia brasiliensis TaxID=2650707 RepID=A0A9W8ICH3_9FUNG|nr:hypothetical protein IWW36_000946 [Coemansia brasiliensis]
MCIAFWRLDNDAEALGGYSLVLAFNRDEYFDRPTRGFHIWEDRPNICAPLDLKPLNKNHRGSWIGTNRQGRLAFLTNFREPVPHHDGKISRGALVRDFLLDNPVTPGGQQIHAKTSSAIVIEYAEKVFQEREMYDGFNLVLFDLAAPQKTAVYITNRGSNQQGGMGHMSVLSQGQTMGLSNSTIDNPWPKVVYGSEKFKQVLASSNSFNDPDEQDTHVIAKVMDVMCDPSPFNGENGKCIPQSVEELAQCIFVPRVNGSIGQLSDGCYGTRTTDVLLLRSNILVIAECNYDKAQDHAADISKPANLTYFSFNS